MMRADGSMNLAEQAAAGPCASTDSEKGFNTMSGVCAESYEAVSIPLSTIAHRIQSEDNARAEALQSLIARLEVVESLVQAALPGALQSQEARMREAATEVCQGFVFDFEARLNHVEADTGKWLKTFGDNVANLTRTLEHWTRDSQRLWAALDSHTHEVNLDGESDAQITSASLSKLSTCKPSPPTMMQQRNPLPSDPGEEVDSSTLDLSKVMSEPSAITVDILLPPGPAIPEEECTQAAATTTKRLLDSPPLVSEFQSTAHWSSGLILAEPDVDGSKSSAAAGISMSPAVVVLPPKVENAVAPVVANRCGRWCPGVATESYGSSVVVSNNGVPLVRRGVSWSPVGSPSAPGPLQDAGRHSARQPAPHRSLSQQASVAVRGTAASSKQLSNVPVIGGGLSSLSHSVSRLSSTASSPERPSPGLYSHVHSSSSRKERSLRVISPRAQVNSSRRLVSPPTKVTGVVVASPSAVQQSWAAAMATVNQWPFSMSSDGACAEHNPSLPSRPSRPTGAGASYDRR